MWGTSKFEASQIRSLLEILPEDWLDFITVPVHFFVTSSGQISVGFDGPALWILMALWTVARGSDVVSGEIGRGTMEMMLAQPVRRSAVLISHSVVTLLGTVVLALSAWLGICIGLSLFELSDDVKPAMFLAPASNLFALGVFFAGFTTLVSSLDRYRWRTIGITVGFLLVSMLLKILAMSDPYFEPIGWLTFLSCFEPMELSYHFWTPKYAKHPEAAWATLCWLNGILIGLGLAAFIAAGVVFCRRDLPAPL